MKNFDWDAFGNEKNKIAVHCKTEKEAIDFCKQSHEHGYDWATGENRSTDSKWGECKEDGICYCLECYCSKYWYEESGYTILKWSDYMTTDKPTFTKSDLKDGDVVLKRNGRTEIAIPSVGTLVCKDGHNSFNILNDDLTSAIKDIYDIIEVRRPVIPSHCRFDCFDHNLGEVVYNRERDTAEEMTLEEICEALGKKIKIKEVD